jgi:DNA-binding MarR family transcriptional regulator
LPLDDLDPETLGFVDEYIDQFVTWDVVAYFHENPDVERRADGIAMDIGRRVAAISPVLRILEDKGVLETDVDEAEDPAYRYSAPAEFRKNMDGFLTATRDRTNRLAIVSRILQKEAKRL